MGSRSNHTESIIFCILSAIVMGAFIVSLSIPDDLTKRERIFLWVGLGVMLALFLAKFPSLLRYFRHHHHRHHRHSRSRSSGKQHHTGHKDDSKTATPSRDAHTLSRPASAIRIRTSDPDDT